jgi:hypothetical protein
MPWVEIYRWGLIQQWLIALLSKVKAMTLMPELSQHELIWSWTKQVFAPYRATT